MGCAGKRLKNSRVTFHNGSYVPRSAQPTKPCCSAAVNCMTKNFWQVRGRDLEFSSTGVLVSGRILGIEMTVFKYKFNSRGGNSGASRGKSFLRAGGERQGGRRLSDGIEPESI